MTSELTNERLKELKSNAFALKSVSEAEQIQMIDELLAIREAGDDEGIRELRYKVDSTVPESPEESAALDALENAAIARGQQLREYEEENTRLEQDIARLKAEYADLGRRFDGNEEEIERLKKILCHVPSRVALEAKESAGYGEHIYPKGEQ